MFPLKITYSTLPPPLGTSWEVLHDFYLINKLVCKAKKGLDLNRTLPQKVIIYSVSDKFLQFDSKEEAARFFKCCS